MIKGSLTDSDASEMDIWFKIRTKVEIKNKVQIEIFNDVPGRSHKDDQITFLAKVNIFFSVFTQKITIYSLSN